MRKLLLLAAAVASFVAAAVAAPIASADYANTVQYQAAISLNCDNKSATFCTQMVGLGGEWEWFAFSNNGSFDATITFCGHNDPVFGSGAFHFNDSGQWQPGPAGPTSPPFGQTQDFWVNDGTGWQDSGIPYLANQSMHYSFKPAPGISAVAQVSYIPNR